MSLYSSAVKKPITTALCFVAVVILGLFSLSKLSIDLLPEIETNTIMGNDRLSGSQCGRYRDQCDQSNGKYIEYSK